jgi:hypothetical protein
MVPEAFLQEWELEFERLKPLAVLGGSAAAKASVTLTLLVGMPEGMP